jgi:type I restriction enzyme, S subunit
MYVPEGWRRGIFEEGIELISGQHVEANLVNESQDGKPYLTGPADFPNGKIIVTKFTNHATKFCSKGDLLITVKRSGTGKVIEADDEYAISRQLMAVRALAFDSKFTYYNLVASVTRYEGAAAGLIPGVTRDDVLHTPILIPPFLEQQKIAQILSTWDNAIEKLEALIAAKQKRKKVLMQQLLTGKKRFAGFDGEWKKVSLRKLGKCIRGVSYKPEQILSIETDDSIRLLRSTNIQNGSLNDKDLVIIPSSLVNNLQVLKDGDLAVCMANGSKSLVGKSAPFKSEKSKYTVGAFCAVFRPNQESNNEFIKFLFQSDAYAKELTILLSGSSINNLKGSDVEGIKFYIPDDKDEQQKIASVLSTADTEIETHQKQLAALKQQKKGLMQQLLTGKKRVKVDDHV